MAFRYIPPDCARNDDQDVEISDVTRRGFRDQGPNERFYELRLPSLNFEFYVLIETQRAANPNDLSILKFARIIEGGFRATINGALSERSPELFKNIPALEGQPNSQRFFESFKARYNAVHSSSVVLEAELERYKTYAKEGAFTLLTNQYGYLVDPNFAIHFTAR